MDVYWKFREAYKKASDLKKKQDDYCSLALAGKWKDLEDFPEDLQWEALVDVVRGRVKVNAHCYEAVDLDAWDTSCCPLRNKQQVTPFIWEKQRNYNLGAVRYKREAYRSSEFAPRILAEHAIRVLLKSDHPVANSRHLLYEAQQAYYYGLPENLAIASVTSTAAEVMGIDHRTGYIKKGESFATGVSVSAADTIVQEWMLVSDIPFSGRENFAHSPVDLVIWDSHPLALGATPSQVFIDGIPQLESAHIVHKPAIFQDLPKVPNFDKEAAEAIEYEGLPPIAPQKRLPATTVFTNITSIYMPTDDSVELNFSIDDVSGKGVAIVRDGLLVCSGVHADCLSTLDASAATFFDLEGGSIAPGLTSFGSPLGLHHIQEEDSTNDGDVFDPFVGKGAPKILGDSAIVRAVDGLRFGSRDA
ncbi:hypothetical protein H0H87_000727 [Tephrocybe sp. NHM501043]|nr:hypothetical protein H0H87_000727 [Tephrocybe sp. NHM501043]